MGVNKIVYGGRTLIDLTGVTVTPDTLAEGVTAYDAKGNLIIGVARIIKYVTWKKYAAASVYTEGAEASQGSATGQTSAISGYDAYSFNADTGVFALTGSSTSHALSSLLSSKKPVYTAVSSDKHTLTWKKVTASNTTTTDAYYTEGSVTSSASSGNSASSTLSGKSSYTFDKTTGQYTISGSRSGSLSTLYNNGYTVYTSGGTSLVYKKVTNKSTSTSSYWSEGSFSTDYVDTDTNFITSYTGYSNVKFNSSTGQWEGSGYSVTYSPMEDEYQYWTIYQIGNHSCTKIDYDYSFGNYFARITYSTATANENTTTTTTYTITTYTKGRNYVAATSSTTYTVTTHQRTASFSHYVAGAFIEDVTDVAGTYPDNGYQDGYWYIKQ